MAKGVLNPVDVHCSQRDNAIASEAHLPRSAADHYHGRMIRDLLLG